MSYFHMITGGSGSGKSEYAEGRLLQSGCSRRFYLATMEAFGEEGRRRVRRHQKLREGKGFVTLEYPRNLDRAANALCGEAFCAVLLECMSNLVANEQFGTGKDETEEAVFTRITEGICRLRSACCFLIVVTNEVFSDGVDYGPETNAYIRILGRVNHWMAEQADEVTEVVYGIPVTIKAKKL